MFNAYKERINQIDARAVALVAVGNQRFNWIADQNLNGSPSAGVGFSRGEGFAYISYADISGDIDELAQSVAEQWLGFPIGSEQDVERHRVWYTTLIQMNQLEVDKQVAQIARWQHRLAELTD